MDGEMREAIRDLRDQVLIGQTELKSKVEGITGALNSHMIESAVRSTRIEEVAKSAHRRIDAHMKGHWWVLGVIGGIISAVGGAIAIALFKLPIK